MSTRHSLPWFQDLYSKHGWKFVVAQAVMLLMVGFLIARIFQSPAASPVATGKAPLTNTAAGPSMWTCSMHPQIRSPNPGECPICGMDLIPVATSSGGLRTINISPATRALMNIATTPVERKYVSHEISLVGKVDFDETKLGYIAAWVPGRLDELYVDYTGIKVNQGDHMANIYSPQLYSVQEELIQALKFQSERQGSTRLNPSIDLVESAREKLRLLGLTEEQVQEIEQQNKPTDHITIYSPVSGVVIEKLKKEGEYVKTGERIYTVADLNQLWIHLDAYESDLPWIRYGQAVTVTTEAYSGDEFHGRIAFIQPVLNDRTRTVKVRVNVPNPEGKLKPDMFVHATVRPQVAAGGRVMDPSLAGKWISPMHPEIVKEEPGKCDICGMLLVRAESLGFVRPETDGEPPPLVIPYSAALVTGQRAIVYVELPTIPEGLEAAYRAVEQALESENLEQVRGSFAAMGNMLEQPYAHPAHSYGRALWNSYADRLAAPVLAGQRLQSKEAGAKLLVQLDAIITDLREAFGPIGQPTFEGREIVLGPRAGNFYLVRNGLQAGEMVVTQGNFKIDAEIQIQAKPSMMTPEGGGGGGHDHGGGGPKKPTTDEHAGHNMSLPAEFTHQVRNLESAYQQVAQAVEQNDVAQAAAAFVQFGRALETVNSSSLTGHARMQWKEFAMLLANDAVEGRDVSQPAEADRVYLLLQGHMRRMREQLGINPNAPAKIERITVPSGFQAQLAAVWERYLAMQKHLAADHFVEAREALTGLESAVASVNDTPLSEATKGVWQSEQSNLTKLMESLRQAQHLNAMREQFKPLSEQVGVLAKAFGFGEAGPIYELHCPMAFNNQGAVWYQSDDQVRNPYFGASMISCADRVEKVIHDDQPAPATEAAGHGDHSQH